MTPQQHLQNGAPAPAAPSAPRAFQRLLLRASLWALVVGAAVGSVCMLAGLYTGGGQVLATFVAAAASASLMGVVTGWLDHREKRAAGVAGLVVVFVAFALFLLAIWGDAIGLWGHRTEWRLIGSALAFVFIAGPAVALLSAAHRPALRWSARAGVPALGVLLLCVLWETWGSPPSTLDHLILVLIWGVPCVVAALLNHTLDRRSWRWLGVLAAALIAADHASMLMGNGSLLAGVTPLLWATAGSVAYSNVVLAVALPAWGWTLRWTAIVSAVAGAYLTAWFEPWNTFQTSGHDAVFRVIAALSLISSCATVGVVLAWRLGAARLWSPRSEPYTGLLVTCPRCSKRQSIALPEAPCISCGLVFRISLFDRRCPVCAYDTSGLASAPCPECGSPLITRPAPRATGNAP